LFVRESARTFLPRVNAPESMFLTQCPKERNKRETFKRAVFFKQRQRDNVQEKFSKELCSRKEPENKSQIQKENGQANCRDETGSE
jgi:hypothetical protein